jgi:hypothetical protein
VVIAALGLGGLAGCRVESDKAAFVGDITITEDKVNEVYEQAVAGATAATPAPEASPGASPEASPTPAQEPVTRQQVVDLMVSLELGRGVIVEKKMPAPQDPTDPAEIAGALRVAPDSEYAKLWASWLDVSTVITENTPRSQLTDAGLMQVYEALVKVQAIQPGLDVAGAREAFGESVFAEAAIMVAGALGEEAERTDTDVNPKYEPLGVPLAVNGQQGPVFYSVPYISSEMVTDVSL